jgi:NAD(P)-dependent dehydrogenase (short-subunit alcohol dehydrogenase family)
MHLNLSGQRIVVCGGARGIGRAISLGFAGEGCQVIGFDRSDPGSEPTMDGIEWVLGDVTNSNDIAGLTARAVNIDHLVYAVGAGSGVAGSPFWNLNPSDWEKVLDVNLIGAVKLAHAFAPGMAERRRGSITLLVSVAGQVGSPTDPPYSAAKAALINFMQVAARDLAPFGVRSNAISPGMVKTDLNRSVWRAVQESLPPNDRQSYDDWADEKISRICPLGRWQTAEEIAAMCVFLASEQARNITGQTINIDGGQVMHS